MFRRWRCGEDFAADGAAVPPCPHRTRGVRANLRVAVVQVGFGGGKGPCASGAGVDLHSAPLQTVKWLCVWRENSLCRCQRSEQEDEQRDTHAARVACATAEIPLPLFLRKIFHRKDLWVDLYLQSLDSRGWGTVQRMPA